MAVFLLYIMCVFTMCPSMFIDLNESVCTHAESENMYM